MTFGRNMRRVGFALFLLLLVLLVWQDRPAGETKLLPNGGRVTFLGVTRTPPHRWVLGNPLQRLLSALLPATGWTWLQGSHGEAKPEYPAPAVVWLRVQYGASKGPFATPLRVFLADEHGCRSDTTGQASFSPDPEAPVGIPLWRYPRHARHLRLEFVDQFASPPGHPLAIFPCPAPPAPAVPGLTPVTLPMTHELDGVRWTLQSFRSGVQWPLASRNEAFWMQQTEAVVQAEPAAALNSRWQIKELRVESAGGDLFPDAPNLVLRQSRAGRTRLWFTGDLFPKEPAWKVHLELARGPNGAFAPGELWTVRMPVPPVNRSLGEEQQINMAGMPVTTSGIGWWGAEPCINCSLHSLEPGWTITLLKLRDDRGRRLLPDSDADRKTVWTSQRQIDFILPFRLKGGERWVDVTMAVQKTHLLEFIAAPTRPNKR